jgi:FkbM family methyltransferase
MPVPARFTISPTFAAHLFKAVFKQHHRAQLPLLRGFVPRDGVVIDVGGHAGQYAKLFAKLAPAGHVYTFEPGSYALRILRAAVGANRLGNVTIVPRGLSDVPGTAKLTIPVKRKRSLGFGLSHMGDDSSGRGLVTETVDLTTLDAFANNAGLSRVDLIKIDIEGWELRMLRGAEATLRRFHPVLLVELVEDHLARAGDDVASAWDYLTGLGYHPHIHHGGDTLDPIDHARQGDVWWLP